MGLGGVGVESFRVKHVEFVHAVGEDVLFHLSRDARARSDGFELHAELVGQLAAFGEEFERNFLDRIFVNFAIYEYVVHSLNSVCALPDGVAVQQFFYQGLHVGIGSREAFAFFGLEHDVLHGLHLGG